MHILEFQIINMEICMSRFAIIYFLPLTKNAREILLHFLSYYINFRRLL